MGKVRVGSSPEHPAADAMREVDAAGVSLAERLAFEAVYRTGELGSPGAGLAYITPIEKMALYIPREIRERVPGQGAPA